MKTIFNGKHELANAFIAMSQFITCEKYSFLFTRDCPMFLCDFLLYSNKLLLLYKIML